MDREFLEKLLLEVKTGELDVGSALDRLEHLPFEDIGLAMIDHHRSLRQGVPEVVLGEGKNAEQVLAIVRCMTARDTNILVTRLSADKADLLTASFPEGEYDPLARTWCLVRTPPATGEAGPVLVVCAGTSDLPVAREAAVTARMLGNPVEELVDVGVSGLHRLLGRSEVLQRAAVIIVVAGMEGALPSVIGGMVAAPVIAVPTSVGYGAAFGGVAALLGMLNSCASGVTVVNIDNGFGAAFAATRINRRETSP